MTKIAISNNLTIYTDSPDFKDDILLLMDTCTAQLEKAGIQAKTNERIIFCTTVNQYNWKTLFIHQKSLAVNLNLFNSILVAPADYKQNQQIKYNEHLTNRRLSDVVVHELTHLYIKEKLGFWKNLKMSRFQKWKIEGFCEYIAGSSSFNIEKGKRIFLDSENQSHDLLNSKILKTTYFYFKSRLKTEYLFSYKQLSFDEFIKYRF
jgi:hypothetical protein